MHFKFKPPCILLAVALILTFVGCGSNEQAIRATVATEQSVINYQRNVTGIINAFIEDYTVQTRAKADALYEAAVASVTDRQTGTVKATVVTALLEEKLNKYAQIEQVAQGMRAKLIAANVDAANAVQYSQALQAYFKSETDTLQMLNRSSNQVLEILARIVGKQSGSEGTRLPAPRD